MLQPILGLCTVSYTHLDVYKRQVVGVFLQSVKGILKLVDHSVETSVCIFGEEKSVVIPISVEMFDRVAINGA